MKKFLKIIILAVLEGLACVFAVVSAGVFGYVDSDDMKLVCVIENDICSLSRAQNAAFAFHIITAVLTAVICVGLVLSLCIKKIGKFIGRALKGANSLCFCMELIVIIMIPVMFEDAYNVSYFKGNNEERQAYWAGAFLSCIFNLCCAVCWFGLKP